MTNKEKYRLLCNAEASIPIFSRDWWLDIVCCEANWDVILIEQKGRVLAALPLYIPYRGIVSMPPYTQTLGPWFSTPSEDTKYTTLLGQRQAYCKTFLETLKAYPHFLQNFSYHITDWLPFYWANYQQTTRYTYLLKDISNPEEIWENMSSHIRRNIVKARDKHHITIKKGISVEEFVKVHTQTFERQEIAVPGNLRILENLILACRQRGQGDLWGAYDEKGRLHAGSFTVWQESSAWYLAGGGNPELRDSGAHSLLLWESIRQLSAVSRQFDFEGSMLPGVERFFREFGATQMPYFTITKGNLSLLYRAWLKLRKIV